MPVLFIIVSEGNVFEFYSPYAFQVFFCWVFNSRFCLQKLVDPGLRSCCTLYQRSDPSQRSKGPGKFIHKKYKLGNNSDLQNFTINILLPSKINNSHQTQP